MVRFIDKNTASQYNTAVIILYINKETGVEEEE